MAPLQQKKMHILCVLDGRPGHEKQTMGIVSALAEKIPVETTKIIIDPWPILKKVWWTLKLYFSRPGITDQSFTKPDLVIGTGSRAHLQMLLFKNGYNIPAVTCMSPDLIYRSKFDLCFVPIHDGYEQKGNIVNTFGPPNCSVNRQQQREDLGLILVGGIDSKSHRWDSIEIVEKIEKIIQKGKDKQWTISSSPRTPDDMVTLLKKVAASSPDVDFYNYSETKAGWVEKQYDKSEIVWVTSDSISMMYEALTAGCKVGLLPVNWIKESNKYKMSERLLAEKGFIIPFDMWQNSSGDWPVSAQLNEAQRCADVLLGKWWIKNLQ